MPIEAAEIRLRAAVEEEEDIFSLTALAQLLADVGRSDEAVLLFEKALKCDDTTKTGGLPSSETRGLAMGWLAALVEGAGSEGAARAEGLYRGALEMNENDPLSMGNYAVFLHRIKRDHTAAAVAYKRAVEAHPSHSSILCKYGGFVKHIENNYAKAEELFEAAIAANPVHAESLGNLAVLLHGQPDNEPAVLDRIEGLYKRAVHADPANANNFSNYGLFLAERRADLTGAEAMYLKAGAVDPFHANSIYNYAVLLDSSLKQPERAETMYRRCLEVNPEHGFALYNLAVLKEETTKNGDYSEARSLFESAVRASPSDALTRADYGRFLALVEKDYDGALENLREAIRCDPSCTTAQFNLGKLLLHRHRPKIEHTQSGNVPTKFSGNDVRKDVRETKVLLQQHQKDVREAKGLLKQVIRDGGEHSGASLCLALALAEEGDHDEAAKHCQSALRGTCTDVGAMSDLAALLGRKGRPSKAIQSAEDLWRCAVSRSPGNAGLLQQQLLFLRDVKKDKRASDIAAAALKHALGQEH